MALPLILFGEAEKGHYHYPYILKTLAQLYTTLGNPSTDSKGIDFAIKALLYERPIIFFRVKEEGYSISDYLPVMEQLKLSQSFAFSALCMPKVSESYLVETAQNICLIHQSLLILSPEDLFDYLNA
jgi:hypothetical protein